MAATWTDEETIKLVELWGDEEVQALLEGCTRNKHVYDKIARGMMEEGYERSGVQCRDKLKKLKAEYKKIKDGNKETGTKRKNWKFYDCMNGVLGDKPATRPTTVIDTLEDTADDEVITLDEAVDVEMRDGVGDRESTNGDGGMEDGDEKLIQSEIEEKVEKVEKKPEKKPEVKEKQRNKKRTREDKFEKAMDVIIEKVTKAQKESDEMFMKLEEKRMKFDEHILEMEDRRLRQDKEREERQRREEREFQYRMMMMMQQGYTPPQPPPTFNPPPPPTFNPFSLHNSSGSSSDSQQWSESDI